MTSYHRPTTAHDLMTAHQGDPGLTVVAGGTDVYPALAARAAWGKPETPSVLDISHVAGLRGIWESETDWVIGATTTWTDIARATQLPPLFDGLKNAARQIGGVQIQNRGTIGGNICTASPAGDSLPCLLALDASIVVGAQPKAVPLSQFIDGYRHTILRPGEIVSQVRIPKRPGRGLFAKLGTRTYLVISIVSVAACVETDAEGRIVSARIAVGACGPVPLRLTSLERDLVGQRPDAATLHAAHVDMLTPIDDVRANADYRKRAALQLVRDTLARLGSSADG